MKPKENARYSAYFSFHTDFPDTLKALKKACPNLARKLKSSFEPAYDLETDPANVMAVLSRKQFEEQVQTLGNCRKKGKSILKKVYYWHLYRVSDFDDTEIVMLDFPSTAYAKNWGKAFKLRKHCKSCGWTDYSQIGLVDPLIDLKAPQGLYHLGYNALLLSKKWTFLRDAFRLTETMKKDLFQYKPKKFVDIDLKKSGVARKKKCKECGRYGHVYLNHKPKRKNLVADTGVSVLEGFNPVHLVKESIPSRKDFFCSDLVLGNLGATTECHSKDGLLLSGTLDFKRLLFCRAGLLKALKAKGVDLSSAIREVGIHMKSKTG